MGCRCLRVTQSEVGGARPQQRSGPLALTTPVVLLGTLRLDKPLSSEYSSESLTATTIRSVS